jgi:AAA family ATP:ADP antiporter
MIRRQIEKLVTVEEGEWRATLLAFLYFFFLLASYYILRPIRDSLGASVGIRNLSWLFTATLIATALLQPISSALVARVPVRRFIRLAYRGFGACLLLFSVAISTVPADNFWLVVAFWIWTSVFNLFVVSVFWSFASDNFRTDQAKRLYGFIALGGTTGGIFGSLITAGVAAHVDTALRLLLSWALLEAAVQCVRYFPESFRDETRAREHRHDSVGGTAWSGVTHVVSSKYLLVICLSMLPFTVGNTMLYFRQAEIVNANFVTEGARQAFLGRLELAVQTLTLFAQLFLTGRVIKIFGVTVTLMILPILSIVGFAVLAIVPTSSAIAAFVIFYVIRRATNFIFWGPGREVLFTVVSAEDKYKAKNLIDTVVYRLGDWIGSKSSDLLAAQGLLGAQISWLAVPMSAVWLGLTMWLGRKQGQLQKCEPQ